MHNHTEEIGASDDDLRSAFDAGAKLLIVITRNGREQVYIRGRGRMVLVRDETASYEVGSPTLDETIELAMKSAKQAAVYLADPPELIFLQEETGFTDRLANAAEELNLDTDLPVSELIKLVLKKREEDVLALHSAAATFYGDDETHQHINWRFLGIT